MKMTYSSRSLSAIAILTLLATSCQKTIQVKVPPVKEQLVINCQSQLNELFNVSVSRTASLNERKNGPVLDIYNASVKLYADGVFVETLQADTFGYHSVQPALPGRQYTIKVSAPGFGDAEATVASPPRVSVTGITRIPNARTAQDGNVQDELIIHFQDAPGTADYYILKLHSQGDSVGFYTSNFCINSPDASVEPLTNDLGDGNTCFDNNGVYLRDALFNGKQKDLILYVSSYEVTPQYNGVDTQFATLELLHVPEAYFRYAKSNQLAKDANDNPFSEPVNVYSNVTNGLGIFSVISIDSSKVR